MAGAALLDGRANAGLAALTAQNDARTNLRAATGQAKAREAAQDFEAVFLNAMFSQIPAAAPWAAAKITARWGLVRSPAA